MTAPVVRVATEQDASAIHALEEEGLGPDAWSLGLVAEGVAGRVPTVRYLVAEVDQRVVGHAVVSAAGDIAELQRIAVTASARRSGVATALLEAVRQWSRGEGAHRLLLEVREGNTGALGFYARHGFVEIDRRPRYYRDGATAIVMRRALTAGCGGSGG
ncbi:ribosomal protein S18-alanine N-acetyltransferase [Nocardioides sp. R-C-SC26]|uniref:ribosomal protein S18-alanine N-acetyltransferase n=1 Tax=Nocardioides sp. R-C-SC26 TaxID=2870414 RepID=UPI001E350AFD|nr:ribosomal protein S18-alanine N-acetyltransferase [Nocardioides sp. R-C-SC26]